MNETELTMKKLRPFWGRVSILESPVDEVQRASSLIVPVKNDGEFIRGGVVEVDSDDPNDRLVPGLVVYFSPDPHVYGAASAVRIADLWIVEPACVLAYEVDA